MEALQKVSLFLIMIDFLKTRIFPKLQNLRMQIAKGVPENDNAQKAAEYLEE